MDNDVRKDSRFSHIANDPRFKRIPRAEQKIKIDKRFQSMFDDGKFKLRYTVDKRGRPVNHSTSDDLRRFYDLSSDGSDSDSSDEDADKGDSDESESDHETIPADSTSKTHPSTTKEGHPEIDLKTTEQRKKNVKKIELPAEIIEKLHDTKVDYARGEGVLMSDSSSDDSSDEDADNLELEHGWGELDRDADRTDEVTNRLAVCHMDWDRIRASDLMVLLSSFLPPGGLILTISIYPSEFGLERMKQEDQSGPVDLYVKDEDKAPEGGYNSDTLEDEGKAGEKYQNERLRQYQLNRLKYFYAVVVCDSSSTANNLYAECDGMEYESSATRLDLRFIPDDTSFDQEPREVCDRVPEPSKYEPRHFTTTALQQAKVELTWDETDPARVEMTQKIMAGKADDVDLQAYLASSSGEEEQDNVDDTVAPHNSKREDDADTTSQLPSDPISKYRALLQGIEHEEETKKSRGVDLEITWGLGLQDKTKKLVDKRLKEGVNGLTPFQQMMEKRKEKKKLKREEKKKKTEKAEEDNPYSDDDIPSDIDMNDPYFAEEFKDQPSASKKKTKKKYMKEEEEDDETKQKKAELELLLMEEDDNRKHFSLKKIQEQESTTLGSKKKRKKKLRKKTQDGEKTSDQDDFQVDVKDDRFSALFSSHHFNIDPADPHYKKTKGMEALLSEKLKRRVTEDDHPQVSSKAPKLDAKQREDAELSLLVKTIKRKTKGKFNR